MFTEAMSISTKLANGLGLTIVGMGVVFCTLALISVALDLLRMGCAGSVKADLPEAGNAPARRLDDTGITPQKDSEQLVSVITAAVAAYTHTRREDFRIRSIRPRREGTSLWGLVGRQQQMKERTGIQVKRGR